MSPPLPESAKALHRELRDLLLQACDLKLLANPQADVFKHLRFKSSDTSTAIFCGIPSGTKNFNRDRTLPHFTRADGAWFDFAVTVRDTRRGLELLGYDFELRFPEGQAWPVFLRYDLNLPDHPNQDQGLRSHLHPGHDELLAPAPLCSPLELLDLFLRGLRPRDPAHPQAQAAPQ